MRKGVPFVLTFAGRPSRSVRGPPGALYGVQHGLRRFCVFGVVGSAYHPACIGPAVDDEHPFPDHGLAVGLEYFEKFRRAAVPDERGARLDLHISLFQAVVGYLVQQPRVGHMEQYGVQRDLFSIVGDA